MSDAIDQHLRMLLASGADERARGTLLLGWAASVYPVAGKWHQMGSFRGLGLVLSLTVALWLGGRE